MIVSTLALLLASAGVQEPAAPPVGAAPPPARERRICRTTERLGTILQARICRPASYWAAIDREQDRITENDTTHMRNNRRGPLPLEVP